MQLYTDRQLDYALLGVVADYCHVCREIQPFAVQRISLGFQLLGIPMSRQVLLGTYRQCGQCHGLAPYDRSAYVTVSQRPVKLAALIDLTNPRVATIHADALALATLVRQAPHSVNNTQRLRLVNSAITAIARQVRHTELQGSFLDRDTRLVMVATLTMVAGGMFGYFLSGKGLTFAWSMMAIGAACTTGLAVTYPRRNVRRDLVPSLAASLAPLQPTNAELDEMLDSLRRAHELRGNVLNTQMIRRALDACGYVAPPEPQNSTGTAALRRDQHLPTEV